MDWLLFGWDAGRRFASYEVCEFTGGEWWRIPESMSEHEWEYIQKLFY